eukprot:evm.model.scf_2885.2 EVM.evm.TU.scf_2885.2   scf_2885:8173-8772(+)
MTARCTGCSTRENCHATEKPAPIVANFSTRGKRGGELAFQAALALYILQAILDTRSFMHLGRTQRRVSQPVCPVPSLGIHVPKCGKMWEEREARKPDKRDRRPVPDPPSEMLEPLPTKQSEIDEFNNKMFAFWNQVSLVGCPNCGRTFRYPARGTGDSDVRLLPAPMSCDEEHLLEKAKTSRSYLEAEEKVLTVPSPWL